MIEAVQSIGIADIVEFFKNDVKTVKRGEEKFKSEHVLSFEVDKQYKRQWRINPTKFASI